MASAHGFVYCLGSEAMPCLYKIGMTSGPPMIRCAQLSSGTAVPVPFKILFYVEVQNPAGCEIAIHKAFNDFRVSESREFFCMDIRAIHSVFVAFKNDSSPMATTRDGEYELNHAEKTCMDLTSRLSGFGIFNPVIRPLGFVWDEEHELSAPFLGEQEE